MIHIYLLCTQLFEVIDFDLLGFHKTFVESIGYLVEKLDYKKLITKTVDFSLNNRHFS